MNEIFHNAFIEEIEKIALRSGLRPSFRKIVSALKKRKGGLKGMALSYGLTMGLAPLTGFGLGTASAPRGKKKAQKEIKKRESAILHTFMPGYSEYQFGRKSKARQTMRGPRAKKRSWLRRLISG